MSEAVLGGGRRRARVCACEGQGPTPCPAPLGLSPAALSSPGSQGTSWAHGRNLPPLMSFPASVCVIFSGWIPVFYGACVKSQHLAGQVAAGKPGILGWQGCGRRWQSRAPGLPPPAQPGP